MSSKTKRKSNYSDILSRHLRSQSPSANNYTSESSYNRSRRKKRRTPSTFSRSRSRSHDDRYHSSSNRYSRNSHHRHRYSDDDHYRSRHHSHRRHSSRYERRDDYHRTRYGSKYSKSTFDEFASDSNTNTIQTHLHSFESDAQFKLKMDMELKEQETKAKNDAIQATVKKDARNARMNRLLLLRKEQKNDEEQSTTETNGKCNETDMEHTSETNGKSSEKTLNDKQILSGILENDIFAKNDNILSTKMTTNTKYFGRENKHLSGNFDDSEGYYVVRLGDIIRGKYEVIGNQGRGVYSSVLRVRELIARKHGPRYVKQHTSHINVNKEEEEDEDMNDERQVFVIKVIRNNEHMKKQGLREIEFLSQVKERDPNNNKYCIKIIESFEYRNHICLVFEAMVCDLRSLLKKIGANQGLSIQATWQYTRQLLKALSLLHELEIIHADIKPDNILVSSDHNSVRLCDFGSSFKCDEVEITPYLGSRFYRAPEIMIGLKWGPLSDVWSLACSLYEIYTGEFLFRGESNNEMLKAILDVIGPYPKKMLIEAQFSDKHFDRKGMFLHSQFDSVSQMDIQIPIKVKQVSNVEQMLLSKLQNVNHFQMSHEQKIKLVEFADLLSRMLVLDMKKRITAQQALKHPFILNSEFIKKKNKVKN